MKSRFSSETSLAILHIKTDKELVNSFLYISPFSTASSYAAYSRATKFLRPADCRVPTLTLPKHGTFPLPSRGVRFKIPTMKILELSCKKGPQLPFSHQDVPQEQGR